MTTKELSLTNLRFSVEGGVAVVLLDRAGEAMNTIFPGLMEDLVEVIERVETDPDIVAVVIGSAKPTGFLAGADIRWFLSSLDSEDAAEEAMKAGQAVFDRLERLHTEFGKPVVAAIHGPCLGGGMELALACSMRICSADEAKTQLGQPEIQLGLLPGAGGTQRLPRLVGIATGLDLILTGRSIRPRRARTMGLVDEVVPKEVLLDIALRRAREAAEGSRPRGTKRGLVGRVTGLVSPQRLQQLALEENPVGRRILFQKAEEQMLRQTRGNYPAAPAALGAVRTGVEKGRKAGLAAEAAAFGRLVQTPEAKALMGIFFATQELKKDTGIDGDAKARPVHKVGVLGGGLMGGGIAAVSALQAGSQVRIKEVDHAGVGRGLAYVRRILDDRVKRRRLGSREADRLMHEVTGTVDYSGFGNVDLVIEAVFEDLELKRSILRDVEAATREDTIFASNTSSLPITDIAAASAHPETVIGMHYFSPVEKMPLLEIIVTDRTADWVTATCVAYGKAQGKTVIVVNDGTGFYTTRILGPYMNEVGWLLDEGVAIEDIDGALTAFGFPVGPVVLMDEVGIDVGAKIAKIMSAAFGERMHAPDNMALLVADDRKGRKNGRGFYRYEDGKKAGVDETVYAVLGATPSTSMARGQIQDRLVLAMVNEAALCLQEGILRSARDGDIGAIYGLGFPPYTGGPFSYIDRLGAAEVVARLGRLESAHGERFAPAQILREHAASGRPFRE
jgi:3-hydroxyacyl-CoA dehydrogenase / enoyl-CoA hydratase / 3-hydroxybutyryl-CoA epimerase